MSWAEDNDIDIYSSLDEDLYDFAKVHLEEMWTSGFHKTKDGRTLRIKDMTDEHLRNTIRYFSNRCSTAPLEMELACRRD
jgi:hypothetical protein